MLYERLKDDYIILIKRHPFVKEKIVFAEKYTDFIKDISDKLSIEDLLLVADICITDYSSVIFEYSLMQRPILFFAYDLEEYNDERGFYYPYESFVPGPVLRTMEELVCYIEHIEQFDTERLKNFKNQYMDGCDGYSTKRILEYIFKETFSRQEEKE